MSTFDPEQLTESANERLNQSAQRDPREFGWGVFAWGDAPPACGGGVGCFQWFASAEEALAFITDYSPAMYCTFDQEDEWQLMRQRLRTIAVQWLGQQVDALVALNAELKGLLQIDWIGHYSELCAGDGAFSAQLVQSFMEAHDVSESAIDPDNQQWLKFLQEYGF